MKTLIVLIFIAFHTSLVQGDNNTQDVTEESPKEPIPFRLPSSVLPRHYKLQVLHLLDEITTNVQNGTGSSVYKRFTAPGKVKITVDVVQPTRNITLHSEELEITEVKVTSLQNSSDMIVPITNRSEVKEVQFLILHLGYEIPQGQYEIYIEFTSLIADYRLNGLYLDYYDDPKSSERRYIATTLFAPNHARKAFPCFDEPALRATFDITIGHLKDKYFSLSNGQVISSTPVENLPGYIWESFETTPSMSTYIVAMITCDFVSVEKYTSIDGEDQYQIGDKTNKTSIQLKIFLPEFMRDYRAKVTSDQDENGTSTEYALSILTDFIDATQHFGPYPLKKLYTIALPHFYFSAMENWGMMTFKYPVLLSISNVTPTIDIFRTLEVTVHEMTHQTFGNLVGIDWWSNVWLKESFSTFYGMLGWPTLFSSEQFRKSSRVFPLAFHVSEMRQQAMNFDEGLDTHPLYNVPKDSAAIGGIYTKIPYKKGASIIRMMFDFLHSPGSTYYEKDTSFFTGLQLYVKRMSYKGASQDDLFDAMQDGYEEFSNRRPYSVSSPTSELLKNVTINEIMNAWTKESGYPLVRVSYDESQQKITLSQEKFVNPHVSQVLSENKTSESDPTADLLWWIPVTFTPKPTLNLTHRDDCIRRLDDDTREEGGVEYTDLWIPGTQRNISAYLAFPPSVSFLMVNPTASGYFRTLYEPKLLGKILQADPSFLPISGAAALIDDYFSFAFAKYVPLETALELTKYLAETPNAAPWQSAVLHFTKIYQMLRSHKSFQPFKEYVFKLIGKVQQKKTNIYRESILQESLFTSIVHKLMKQFDPLTCDQEVLKSYNTWRDLGSNPFHANDQEWSYCSLLSSASDCGLKSNEIWNFLEDSYNEETYSVAKSKYLRGLSCSQDPEDLLKLLHWTVDPCKNLHDTDRVQIVQYVIDNPIGKDIAFEFMDNNFESLFKNLSAANPITEGMKTMVLYMNTPEDLTKLESFISKYSSPLGSKKSSLEKLLKQVKLNILWMSEDFPSSLEQWTAKENSKDESSSTTLVHTTPVSTNYYHCFNDLSMYNN